MRRWMAAMAAVCLLSLTGCSGEQEITGAVVETCRDDATGQVYLVVETEEKTVGVGIQDNTTLWEAQAWDQEGTCLEGLRKGEKLEEMLKEPSVFAHCQGGKTMLPGPDGEEIPVYGALSVEVTEYWSGEKVLLVDGIPAEVWEKRGERVYQLEDGTELLRVGEGYGPDGIYSADVLGLDTLNEEAREKILDFYRAKGVGYDVQEGLERAYSEWKGWTGEKAFQAYYVVQEHSPVGSNEELVSILTTVRKTVRSGYGEEIRSGQAFWRDSGEPVDAWDLFGLPEEEAKEKIAQVLAENHRGTVEEYQAALRPEYVILLSDGVEIAFPAGAAPGEELAASWFYDYGEGVGELIQPWARAKKEGEQSA